MFLATDKSAAKVKGLSLSKRIRSLVLWDQQTCSTQVCREDRQSLSFAGLLVSVPATQLCHCSTKVTTDGG